MAIPLEPHVLEWRCTTERNALLLSAVVWCDEEACGVQEATYRGLEEEALALLDLVRSLGRPSFTTWEWPDGPTLRSRAGNPTVASSLRRTAPIGSVASASYVEHVARALPGGRVQVVVREHRDDALAVDRTSAWEAWLVPVTGR